jgi:hypothetical protein
VRCRLKKELRQVRGQLREIERRLDVSTAAIAVADEARRVAKADALSRSCTMWERVKSRDARLPEVVEFKPLLVEVERCLRHGLVACKKCAKLVAPEGYTFFRDGFQVPAVSPHGNATVSSKTLHQKKGKSRVPAPEEKYETSERMRSIMTPGELASRQRQLEARDARPPTVVTEGPSAKTKKKTKKCKKCKADATCERKLAGGVLMALCDKHRHPEAVNLE